MNKTVQLRRYRIADGEFDSFVAWWRATMPDLRVSAGFTVEFAYGLRATSEFIWAVSAPDPGWFDELERAYLDSDARKRVFAGLPQRVVSQEIDLVDVEWPFDAT